MTVRDNGVGMNDTEVARIFERFYRADDSRTSEISGTGLGLPIVEQVVKLHHGEIHVTSREERGTTFIVTLPKL